MGLFNTYSDANKVTQDCLQQSLYLLQDQHQGGWHRLTYKMISTKRYGYVGMDMATAQACADAKKQQYQISSYTFENGSLSPTTVDGAQAVATHQDGCMYNVDINVDLEQVTRFDYIHDWLPSRNEILSNFLSVNFDE